MLVKQSAAKKRGKPASTVLLRYCVADTRFGVSRETVIRLAQTLGLRETQVVHAALATFARRTLPQYEPDDKPLTTAQEKAIKKLVPQNGFVSTVQSRLSPKEPRF